MSTRRSPTREPGETSDPTRSRRSNAGPSTGWSPDLTVVLDVDASTGRSRRGDVHDRLEREGDAFHEAARQHFLALAAAHPDRYLVVDATLPSEEIHTLVLTRLRTDGIAVGEAS